MADEKDAPLAAIFCLVAGTLTFLWGVMIFLAVRNEEYDGPVHCWWPVVYLAGAGITLLLSIASIVRREELRLWTMLVVAALLLQFGVAVVLAN